MALVKHQTIIENILAYIWPNIEIGILSENVFIPTCVFSTSICCHWMDCIKALAHAASPILYMYIHGTV